MKAILFWRACSDARWIFESELDGERCLVSRKGEQVRLMSRLGRSLEHRYPELLARLHRQCCERLIGHGKIVALEAA